MHVQQALPNLRGARELAHAHVEFDELNAGLSAAFGHEVAIIDLVEGRDIVATGLIEHLGSFRLVAIAIDANTLLWPFCQASAHRLAHARVLGNLLPVIECDRHHPILVLLQNLLINIRRFVPFLQPLHLLAKLELVGGDGGILDIDPLLVRLGLFVNGSRLGKTASGHPRHTSKGNGRDDYGGGAGGAKSAEHRHTSVHRPEGLGQMARGRRLV